MDTFDACQLDRKPYAEDLLKQIKSIRRNISSNAYVFAIDAPCGTGKTTFINMFKNMIADDASANVEAVLYNAWENDYHENPFEPLFYDIISNDVFEKHVEEKNMKKLLEIVPTLAKAFGKDLVKSAAKLQYGLDIEESVKAFSSVPKTVNQYLRNEVPSFEKLASERKAFKEFKNYLTKASTWLNKRSNTLLIIVDELDRCRPLFAIQTLEIIKHLFDVDSLVFLLAVDFGQLRHSIATVYGQEMDSDGYLRRFVSSVRKFPDASKGKYVEHLIDSDSLMKTLTDSHEMFRDIFSYPALSLRDVNVLYEHFQQFIRATSFGKRHIKAALPYLIAIMIKFVDSDIYLALSRNEKNNQIFEESNLWKWIGSELTNGKVVCDILKTKDTISKRISGEDTKGDTEQAFLRHIETVTCDKEKIVREYILEKIEFN